MTDDRSTKRTLDRRGFLKGSALFAALVGLGAAAPAVAQEPQTKSPDGDAGTDKTEQPPAPKKKPLLDKNGREYRVCDMCGGNMYLQEHTWTCEQCGYSYQE